MTNRETSEPVAPGLVAAERAVIDSVHRHGGTLTEGSTLFDLNAALTETEAT